MMYSGSSSSEPEVDWEFEERLAASLKDSCADATAKNPNNPSQPFMPTITGSTNLGGESSNLQNLNQNQLQLQQATGSSGYLKGGVRQQGYYTNLNFSAPVGFATPGQFASVVEYHHYIIRQIRILKERYYGELLKMHYNAMELRSQATNMDESLKYQKVTSYLERMMTFLNISRVDSLPKNDEMIYNNMNTIVNYVSYHMNKPFHLPPKGPQLQPFGAMRLQNNPYQGFTNLEANTSNVNKNFPSGRPQTNITSFQTARHPSVLCTTQQINLGPTTSSVNGSGYPISLFSKTTATNFPSRSLNHQPPVANQNFDFGKMKAPMHKINETTNPISLLSNTTRSRVRHGLSPLCSGLVNRCPSTQCSLPSTVNPIPQKTPISTPKFDVNSVLTPHSTPCSPLLLSSNSSTPSKTPLDPPSQEPETSKDQAFHLTEVVKSVSSNALISSSTDVGSIEKVTDIIPDSVPPNLVSTHIQDEMNDILEHDHAPLQKRKRELSLPSVNTDQIVSKGRDICSTETSANKSAKIEKNCAILEEINKSNSKLLETSIDVVIDPSEYDINILEPHDGTIVKCSFRNVCFLLGPRTGASSEKMPEFVILLHLPDNYPASAPRIIRSSRDVLNEPWGKLYDEMLSNFNLSLFGITGVPSLGDMARKWEASVRAIVTEFLKKRGGKDFSETYGCWDNCMNSSSSSN